jgi:exopolysaccharide biosynthesis polyprenyl glycosylphosphotransferase
MFDIFGHNLSKWKLLLFGGDFVCFVGSISAALYINTVTARAPWEFLTQHTYQFFFVGATYFIVLYIGDVYDHQKDFRRPINIASIFVTSWVGAAVVAIIYYFPFGSFVGRTLLIIQALTFSLLLSLWRFVFSAVALPERLQKRLLIVGAGRSGQRLLKILRKRSGWGFAPIGFIDDDPQKMGTLVEGLPVLGGSDRLNELIAANKVSLVAVAITHQKSDNLINRLIKSSWAGCQLIDMPILYEILTGKLPTSDISENWLFQWNLNNSRIYYRRVKRGIDLILAIFSLLGSWPIFAIVSFLIKIDSPGPIFFRQQRSGQEGKQFMILKFRTMVQYAECNGPLWTKKDDPRITRVGRIIRKLRLDELPQIINILKGEMSFIGPRPLADSEYNGKIPFYNYRLLVKPGLTGWAQVMYPDGLTIGSTTEKIKYDIYYIKNMSFLLDIAILLKTVRIVLFGRGM